MAALPANFRRTGAQPYGIKGLAQRLVLRQLIHIPELRLLALRLIFLVSPGPVLNKKAFWGC